MNKIIINVFALALLLLSVSCVDVIDWEGADESSGSLVVEGLITSERATHQVKLSRTQPVIEETLPDMVSGAVVEIHEGNNVFLLKETMPGVYETDTIQGKVGKTYLLKIIVDQQTYEATAQMLPAQRMEPVEVFPWGEEAPQQGGDYFQFIFRDNFGNEAPMQYWVQSQIPENVADYYPPDWQMPQWIADRLENGRLITSDSSYYLHPGLEPPAILAYGETNVSGVTYGTRVVEKFYSMTDEHYAFIRAMMSETEWQGLGPFSYISANAPTNISNGGLGFFAASDVYQIEQVVE
ncbi:MAG: DUF4249 domain-containing protein [Chitinophagales bacterium]|nr:DUF4249 domain-containing protein [Chitinophagales bacterium]